MCQILAYEINHLEMSKRTNIRLSKSKKDIQHFQIIIITRPRRILNSTASQKWRCWMTSRSWLNMNVLQNIYFFHFPRHRGNMEDRQPQIPAGALWGRLVCLTELTLTMRSYIIEKHNDTFYCVTLKPLKKVWKVTQLLSFSAGFRWNLKKNSHVLSLWAQSGNTRATLWHLQNCMMLLLFKRMLTFI